MTTTQFTPHAYITLSNCGGIELMLNHSGDGVSYRFNYGQDNLQDSEIFEAEITCLFGEDDEEGNTGFYHMNDPGSEIFYSLNSATRLLNQPSCLLISSVRSAVSP